jgi:bifunctional UDP-N-acetylglucosamine pyrophosphorylase / glucosamine-1-phosphate N-acetyltransferase
MSEVLSPNKSKSGYLTVVLLAAGKGTRMNSPLPKVLHPVAGRPMIERIIKSCYAIGANEIRVVIGHGGNLVKSVVEPLGAKTFFQTQQLGTADAVKSANIESIPDGEVLILNGDHPLLTENDLKKVMGDFREEKADIAVVTAKLKNPGSFGRVVRQKGELRAIVEAKDASSDTLKINEVNTGIYITKADVLHEYINSIENHNSKGEYYLTDIISLGIEGGLRVRGIVGNSKMAHGVNTQVELAKATKYLYKVKVKQLLEAGVLILDPSATYIEESVEVGPGTVIYPGAFIRGKSKIGSFSVIEPHVFISDCEIGDSVQIKAGSYCEASIIRNRASVGPYARLRPESDIGEEAHLGNFVETKKVKFGARSKAGHLTYLGDAEVGTDTNIGCGTITCNYATDRKKYKTKIGSRVFVGSDSQFIAPIEIGDDSVIGSGSTITKDVPARALAVARGRQFVKENYVAVENKPTEDSKKN